MIENKRSDCLHTNSPVGDTTEFTTIYFYGAGCIPEKTNIVKTALAQNFPKANILVESDLLGAAHALCGKTAGIACILGTGIQLLLL